MWLAGPFLLWHGDIQWPKNSLQETPLPAEFVLPKTSIVQASSVAIESSRDPIKTLINCCSSSSRLKRLTAWLLRCKDTLKQRKTCKETVMDSSDFEVPELKKAELEQVRYVLRQSFPNLFSHKGKDIPHVPRSLQKLCPFILNGVLRVGGRLENVEVDLDAKHPIILPKESHLTEPVVTQYHVATCHSGSSHTWSEIRRRYWIIKGGAIVCHSIGKCVVCKPRNSSVGEQLMAELPGARLHTNKSCFSLVGVDYCGPFIVRQGRSSLKRYGCQKHS